MKIYRLFGWCCLFVVMACQPDTKIIQTGTLENSLNMAGDNRKEIEKVLAHYRQHPADSLKLKAAILLISNMDSYFYYSGDWLARYDSIFTKSASLSSDDIVELKESIIQKIGEPDAESLIKNLDLKTLTSSFLISHIDQAFNAWYQSPWRQNINFDTFCNFILPYKNFSETPEQWRTPLKNRYNHLLQKYQGDSAIFKICERINDDMASWLKYDELYDTFFGSISISNILQGKRGNCNEIANFSSSANRALGIPVTIDRVPQYGNSYTGHTFNALMLNDQKFASFWGAESNCFDFLPYMKIRWERKIPKVYRKMLAPSDSSFAMLASKKGITQIPSYLRNTRYVDVTNYYTTTTDITLSFAATDGTPVYLGVFQSGDWEAVAGSFIENSKATFSKIGTNILYLPLFYEDGEYEAAGDPFILAHDKTRHPLLFKKSSTQLVNLYRICPIRRKQLTWHWNHYLVNCRFEAANSPDFSDAITLHTITKPLKPWQIEDAGGETARDRLEYPTLWQEAAITTPKKYRYVRMIAHRDTLKIGELAFFEANSKTPSKGKIIGNVSNPGWAFDGVIGQSLIDETPNKTTKWVGLDFGKPIALRQINYLPPNDKNTILPNKNYELFYWDNQWVSLGRQKANGFSLRYNQVPSNTLYWLTCFNCQSSEERPFTYQNGKQIWW